MTNELPVMTVYICDRGACVDHSIKNTLKDAVVEDRYKGFYVELKLEDCIGGCSLQNRVRVNFQDGSGIQYGGRDYDNGRGTKVIKIKGSPVEQIIEANLPKE